VIALLILLQDPILDVAAHDGKVAVARQSGVTLDGKAVKADVGQITGVAFSPAGALAVFGGVPGKSGAIDTGGWRAAEHKDLVNAAAFGADWVATGSHDKTIRIYSADGKHLRTLEGHASAVIALAASPDGKGLVSGGADSTIRLWDPATGELKRTIANHGDRVNALAWSPDGKYLASASRDRTVRVWQPELGRLVRIVKFDGDVLDVAWGASGIAACADGVVRLIEADSDKILKEWDAKGRVAAVAHSDGVLAAVETKIAPLR
jgi:WD40 repeat protein